MPAIMPPARITAAPVEGRRIDLYADEDVRFWVRRWGVTRSQLRDAVRAVGTNARAVEQWLRI